MGDVGRTSHVTSMAGVVVPATAVTVVVVELAVVAAAVIWPWFMPSWFVVAVEVCMLTIIRGGHAPSLKRCSLACGPSSVAEPLHYHTQQLCASIGMFCSNRQQVFNS